MKICLFVVLTLIISPLHSQVLIHAHNDYEKPVPLFNAIGNKVFAIEADVYLVNGKLAVAHDRKDIDTNRTLSSLYLQPLDSMFRVNRGYVSKDKSYKPVLVVDIKADGEKVLQLLRELIVSYPHIFNRKTSPGAIYILVSGDRGQVDKWKNYPVQILFDGRPTEVYDNDILKKVVTISESYGKYFRNNQTDTASLKAMIANAHSRKKLVRLWGAPDIPATWKLFRSLGIDIINTDKVDECRKTFAAAF